MEIMTIMTIMTMMNMKVKNKIINENLIISDGCCVQYDDTLALDDVTFSVTEGKLVAVVGPNGGGKSTLFKAITGLIPLANGSLQIDGMEPNTAKSIISYIPQKAEINWNFSLTVKQVVEMGLTSRNSIGYFSQKTSHLTIIVTNNIQHMPVRMYIYTS